MTDATNEKIAECARIILADASVGKIDKLTLGNAQGLVELIKAHVERTQGHRYAVILRTAQDTAFARTTSGKWCPAYMGVNDDRWQTYPTEAEAQDVANFLKAELDQLEDRPSDGFRIAAQRVPWQRVA